MTEQNLEKNLAENQESNIFNPENFKFQNIFEHFETSRHGLDNNEVVFRLKKYGPNKIIAKKELPAFIKFLAEFKDVMVIILLIAATISLITKEFTDAVVIYIVVLINGIISYIQKNKAEKAVEALKKMVSPQARVIRQNQQNLIDTADLVPGDILILSEGDLVPGDAILISSNEFETSEAILTGESSPIFKIPFDTEEKGAFTTIDNIIFSGTTVTRGNGLAIAIKTGSNSEFGQIASLTLSTQKDLTPLEKELKTIGAFSAIVVLAISFLIFIYEILFARLGIIETFLFVAAIAVAAVPEGLPATITIALTLGVQKLSKHKAIVKQLSAAETLGACNIICTDKTGTITKNEMTVTAAFLDNYSINFSGSGYEPTGKIQLLQKESSEELDLTDPDQFTHFMKRQQHIYSDLFLLSSCALLCNNSGLVKRNDQYLALGDPTEACLITMGAKLGFDVNNFKSNFLKIHELPFDSDRKLMTVIAKNLQTEKLYAFCKGAPEQILNICDQKISKGKTTLLTKSQHQELSDLTTNLASDALRVVGFAYKEISSKDLDFLISTSNFTEKLQLVEKKLNFIGLTAMFDPPRDDVKAAIAATKKAGIKTFLLTGDHGLTAAKIAEQIGLISKEHPAEIINGEDLNQISDGELENILRDYNNQYIFARINPQHKLRIVSALKNLENVVAVTGDGVNDAPALKKADIGVCMGQTGTDISRDAANLILANDSYSTIIAAIKEGRIIYENLKKFIHYIFSSNIGEVMTIVFCLILGLPTPLTALLLLTINLATDLFPALALGIEPGETSIMSQPPRGYHQKILDRAFVCRVLIIGFGIGAMVTASIIFKLMTHGWQFGAAISPELSSGIYSLTFANLVIIQIINTFNSRSQTQSVFKQNPLSNNKLLLACLFSLVIALGTIYIPMLAHAFNLAPLELNDWIAICISSLFILLIDEVRKSFLRKKMAKAIL